jgi:Bacterial TSP3 repeat
MKGILNNKFSSIIFLLLVIALSPHPVSATIYDPFYVWNEDGTPIRNERGELLAGNNPGDPAWSGHSGDLIQVLFVGDDGVISPPDTDGNPTGDDELITTTAIGWGTPWDWAVSGRFCLNLGREPDRPDPRNDSIYARAFNAPTLTKSSFYGDSTTFIAKSDRSFPVNQYSLLATNQPLDSGDDDGDGLNNSWEKSLITDPKNPDSDEDGLLDGEEKEGHTLPAKRADLPAFPDIGDITFNVQTDYNTGTVINPNNTDTDGDTYLDYDEVVNLGSDPNNPNSPGAPAATATPPPTATATPTSTATPKPTATLPIPTTPTPSPTPSTTPTPSPQPTSYYMVLDGNDFNGDGTSEIAIYREGLWAVRSVTRVYFGNGNDQPASGDYNGDGTSDITIFRRSTGLWALRGITRVYFGSTDDRAAPADYSGNGITDIAIYRAASGLWAIRNLTRFYFGTGDDAIIPADYDGDGIADPGIYRERVGLWAIRGMTRTYFGRDGDKAMPVDYDGNDTANIGIFRQDSGLWVFRGVTRAYFGRAYDIPVSSDYRGAGMDEIGIFRPSSGLWAIRSLTRAYFGRDEDIPLSK